VDEVCAEMRKVANIIIKTSEKGILKNRLIFFGGVLCGSSIGTR